MKNRKNTLTSMNYWFPVVKGLDIPVPKTEMVAVPDDLRHQKLFPDDVFMDKLKGSCLKIGYPVFMRTDLCSGKHDWKNTCFVPDEDHLRVNLRNLLIFNELADINGLPYDSIAIREFLDLEIGFKAFSGEMPINKERRYFVEQGELLCHHPYWPAEAFENRHCADPNWRAELEKLNQETPEEIEQLTRWAERVGEDLGGFWSVDFAKTKTKGWYLIDMAVGEASYHWEGCPNESRRVYE